MKTREQEILKIKRELKAIGGVFMPYPKIKVLKKFEKLMGIEQGKYDIKRGTGKLTFFVMCEAITYDYQIFDNGTDGGALLVLGNKPTEIEHYSILECIVKNDLMI